MFSQYKKIYFNNASTTEILPEVKNIIKRELKNFENPSDISIGGLANHKKIIDAKWAISNYLNCKVDNIIFTASGSEGDNFCIKMLADSQQKIFGKNHIITSTIEHKAVLNSCKYLENHGFNVTYINPKEDGTIDVKDIENAITPQTGLISIMYVNNILGTIQPIKEICDIVHQYDKILFHSDMVQALNNLKIDLTKLDVDAATFSGHKINGPKLGFVYIKNLDNIEPLINGGGQEFNKRAGTENLPYIYALSYCVGENYRKLDIRNKKEKEMYNYLISELQKFSDIMINNKSNNHTFSHIHLCFKNISGDYLVSMLSKKYNICVSAGSACNTGSMDPDYVLQAINISDEYINGALRISINEYNTIKECKKFIKYLKEEINHERGYI